MSDGHVISFHLKEILEAFNAPIKFDQAWALVFVYLSKVQDDNRWDIIDSLQQIFIHQEGVSVQNISDQTGSEVEFLESFGRTIYAALDYGYEEDEEPDLPAGLENLIAYMTGTIDSDPDDDGYSEKIISIRTVLKMCQKHVGTGYREHYHRVVRAFYSEAQELTEFLSKISCANDTLRSMQSNVEDEEIDELSRNQWSQVWLSVMKSLRAGVTLRRVEHHELKVPVQFEYSPYEMLLDDIRKKSYSLKKVDKIPESLRKDTHDIILGT